MTFKEIPELAHEIDRDLRAIRETLRRPLEVEFARGHLTGPQQSAMAGIVRAVDGMSLKELSAHLGLAHSTTSGIVDRLEERGLVMRKQDDKDGRFTRITASPKVRRFIVETTPKLSIHPLVEALRSANQSERALITRGLKTLRAVLERQTRRSHADRDAAS
jgi:DNA-binding MarR family transcriptional regulator